MTPAEPPPRRPFLVYLAAALALYLALYFPAFTFMTRHPEYQRCSILWRPVPAPIRQLLFRVWSKLDPTGLDIVQRQAAAQPLTPASP